MTDHLDIVGRREGHALRASTRIDAEDGLQRLHADSLRRRSAARVGAAAVAVFVAVSAGAFGQKVLVHDDALPAGPGQVDPDRYTLCHMPGVQCLPGRSALFDLADPVHWVIPEGYDLAAGSPTATKVEVRWQGSGASSGVLILEKLRPVNTLGQPVARYGSSTAPRHFAEWLASRPFLDATRPSPTSVGGHDAWQVRAQLAPGANPPRGSTCGFPCYPLTRSDVALTTAQGGGSTDSIWDDLVVDYTFVSLPSGTAVVWSWAFDHDTSALERNRTAVDGITWPPG